MWFGSVQFSSVTQSCQTLCDPWQHARPSCLSPTARVYPKPCPLNWWCHPTISSNVVPFSSHLQSFLASGSFQMSQLFASGSQSIGGSVSTSVLPKNIQDWFPSRIDWFDLLAVQRTHKSLLQPTVQKHQFFGAQPSLWSSCHIHTWLMEKNIALTIQTFVSKVMFLLFNMLSRSMALHRVRHHWSNLAAAYLSRLSFQRASIF